MTFTAEATNSGGELFATFKVDASSLHYPLSVLFWGADSGTIQSTDTAAPLPTRIYGNDTANPIGVDQIGYVAPSTTVTVTGYTAPSTTVTVTGYVAPSTTVTVTGLTGLDASSRGESSTTPLYVQQAGNDTTNPIVVRGVTDSRVPISGSITAGIDAITTTGDAGALDATNSAIRVTIVNGADANDTTVTIAALSTTSIVRVAGTNDTAAKMVVDTDSAAPPIVRVTSDSATALDVNNDSNQPLFVRGVGDSTIPVSGTVTITALSTTSIIRVTGTNDTSNPIGVTADTQTRIQIEPAPGRGFPVNALSSAGGLQTFTTTVSSVATTVTSSVARLYGYHFGNPDSAGDAYIKIYQDDSGGVTLGTSSAVMDLFLPFGGGAVWSPGGPGVDMDSGISIAAAGGAGSTNHTAPSTTLVATVWYKDVSG